MDHGAGEPCCNEIAVSGVVQGVGFRPFVLRLAQSMGILGSVRNQGGAVVIRALCSGEILRVLIDRLRSEAPAGASIVGMDIHEAEFFQTDGFYIEDSSQAPEAQPFPPPDAGICPECVREAFDADDRHYRNPFNSCVACGPRFSVIRNLPYDRDHTAMDKFPLCDLCAAEYKAKRDRRFHAQTICCNHCGPSLTLFRKHYGSLQSYGADHALDAAIQEINRGNIVAIKGVGGFHFACSPYHRHAVDGLRGLKRRDNKPFAVMFGDIGTITAICEVSGEERKLLLSPERPIVLLPVKNPAFADDVLRGDERCGCFLPYTALHAMLLEQLGALVLTSANRSGSAIYCDNTEMLEFLEESDVELFTSVLLHDREILRCVEDSVVQLAGGAPQILRWSRGYAPAAIPVENRIGDDYIAMGGDLKASFCLVKGGYAYRSQYFGDLEEQTAFDRYSRSIQDFERLFGTNISRVLCDKHPGYHSSALAERLGLPLTRVQHHHAHIASVMAEYGMNRKVIGVAFDGTGYGDDGCTWGGEFLLCEDDRYTRAGHLGYVGIVGGDSAARDAGKTALCFLYASGDVSSIDTGNLCDHSGVLYAALKSGMKVSRSSSMGRLFDAAAAVLGICGYNSYEGECAIRLQQAAQSALGSGVRPYPLRFRLDEDLCPDAAGLVRELFFLRDHVNAPALALGFHYAVADMTGDMCDRIAEREHCDAIALSGGVFQNGLLLELVSHRLETRKLRVYTNRQSPPNDGGLALGQAYIGGKRTCV